VSVQTVTDMRTFEGALGDDIVVHRYPSDPEHRRSGSSIPQPGDVARCGHVKQVVSHPSEFPA
jgi:hypothetical protein